MRLACHLGQRDQNLRLTKECPCSTAPQQKSLFRWQSQIRPRFARPKGTRRNHHPCATAMVMAHRLHRHKTSVPADDPVPGREKLNRQGTVHSEDLCARRHPRLAPTLPAHHPRGIRMGDVVINWIKVHSAPALPTLPRLSPKGANIILSTGIFALAKRLRF